MMVILRSVTPVLLSVTLTAKPVALFSVTFCTSVLLPVSRRLFSVDWSMTGAVPGNL